MNREQALQVNCVQCSHEFRQKRGIDGIYKGYYCIHCLIEVNQ
jgi:hypothetical protein